MDYITNFYVQFTRYIFVSISVYRMITCGITVIILDIIQPIADLLKIRRRDISTLSSRSRLYSKLTYIKK